MKQYWLKVSQKIDSLTLRERAIIFGMAAFMLIMLVNTALLDPQFKKQNELSQRIRQEQSQTAGIQAEIQQKVKLQDGDPDKQDRERLVQLRRQALQINDALRNMQKGLVSPDKMAELLESILKRNTSLKLVSLKSLPASNIAASSTMQERTANEKGAAVQLDKATTASAASPVVDAIYKHGVEIKVQGAYLDMLAYMTALEETSWQLLWGKADLTVDEYPKSTLTLTLYTLSLDRRWLNL